MKNLLLIGLLSVAVAGSGRSEPTRKAVESAVGALIPEGWKMSSDGEMIIGSASKIKLLNPISLPALSSEESVWEKYSWESDFNVVVRITPKIDEGEYVALVKLRAEFLDRRVRDWEKQQGEKMDPKSRHGLEREIHAIIPLPYCHSENQSIWLTTTDAGLLQTRPKTARDFSDGLRKVLAKEFTLYAKDR